MLETIDAMLTLSADFALAAMLEGLVGALSDFGVFTAAEGVRRRSLPPHGLGKFWYPPLVSSW
jgi:hypothetical protein